MRRTRCFTLGRFAWLGVVGIVVACGGGSNGGMPETGSTGGSNVGTAVGGTSAGGTSPVTGTGQLRVIAMHPTQLTSESYTPNAPSASLSLSFDGDVSSIDRSQLHVILSMPDTIFDGTSYSLDKANKRADLTFLAQHLSIAPGTYTNTMQVSLCLDQACSRQPLNSPVSIPYTFTVWPILELEPETLTLTQPFGSPLSTRVKVDLPHDTTSWSARVIVSPVNVDCAKASDGSANVEVFSRILPMFEYHEECIVDVSATNPAVSDVPLTFQRTLKVDYTITANPSVPFVVLPLETDYEVAQGDTTQKHVHLEIASPDQSPGGDLKLAGTYYMSAPDEAAGLPHATDWLLASSQSMGDFTVKPCASTYAPTNCLPPGTYVATIRYRYTSVAGAINELDHTVKMTIVP